MSRGFTHYWNRESWDASEASGWNLQWLASSLWERAGVGPGDAVYPVTLRDGTTYLGGRMIVDRVVSRAEALRILGTDDIWDAPLVALGRADASTGMDYNRIIPPEIVRRLRFDASGEERPPVLHGDVLDQQTLRGVRRLTPAARDLLEDLLA